MRSVVIEGVSEGVHEGLDVVVAVRQVVGGVEHVSRQLNWAMHPLRSGFGRQDDEFNSLARQ